MIKIRGKEITAETFAKMLDISLLNPQTSEQEIRDLLAVCLKYDVNSCCVNPNYLDLIVQELKGTDVLPCVVIDYPFGTSTPEAKVFMVEDAIKRGAKIIDQVIEFGALKSGNPDKVTKEIAACVEAAQGYETRFIVEVDYLTPDEVVQACKCVVEGGGDYLKTSTGRVGGPEMKIMKLIRDTLAEQPGETKIKVAGTGRFWTTAVALGCVAAGADIIGTRAGEQIIDELPIFEDLFSNIEFVAN